MFGKIRSASSLDFLERPPSKILKDDCLSIYETTLMKLKLGSQRDSSPPIIENNLEDGETDSNSSSSSTEAMNTVAHYSPASFPKDSHELANSTKDLMTVDSDYSTTSTISTSEASEDCQATEHSTQRRMKNSILYLFSKFKNSPGISTIMEEAMTIEGFRCEVISQSSSAIRSADIIKLHSEQESIDSDCKLEKVL